jgi:hypothetical protein
VSASSPRRARITDRSALLAAGQRRRPRRGHGAAGGQATQLLDERGAVARPQRRILGQHAREQRVDRRRQIVDPLAGARRLVEEDLGQHRHHVAAEERRPPGQALVEHRAQGEDVGARIDPLRPLRLLGGDVAGGADHAAREADHAAHAVARDAEIQELDVLEEAADEEEVPRLDVAVHHAARVHRRQRAGGPLDERQALADRQAPPEQALAQRLAVEPLHRQVLAGRRPPVRHVAHDARVIELGEDARLLGEALERRGVEPGQHLQRHRPRRLPIDRPVDDPHAAGSGEPVDLEAFGDELRRLRQGGDYTRRTMTRVARIEHLPRGGPATGCLPSELDPGLPAAGEPLRPPARDHR